MEEKRREGEGAVGMSIQVDSYPILPMNQENSNTLYLLAIACTNLVLSEEARQNDREIED